MNSKRIDSDAARLDPLERLDAADMRVEALARSLGSSAVPAALPLERVLERLALQASRRERRQRQLVLAAALLGALPLVGWWVLGPRLSGLDETRTAAAQPAATQEVHGAADPALTAPLPAVDPKAEGSIDPSSRAPLAPGTEPPAEAGGQIDGPELASSDPNSSLATPLDGDAAARLALQQAWSIFAADSGAPAADSPTASAWWSTAPGLARELRSALRQANVTRCLMRSHRPALEAALAIVRAEQGQSSPAQAAPNLLAAAPWSAEREMALFWLGLEGGASAARELERWGQDAQFPAALALRALAAGGRGAEPLARSLLDPARAAQATGALVELNSGESGRLLAEAWRGALLAQPAWSEQAMTSLIEPLLQRGESGLRSLLGALERSPADGARRGLTQCLANLDDRRLQPCCLGLADAIAREHSALALELLSSLERPAALLALLELAALGRGPTDPVQSALRERPVAADQVWLAASESELTTDQAALLLDGLLSRGSPNSALPALIARGDLARDARLWAIAQMGESADSALADGLLESCLRLPPGEERLAAAGLQSAARLLGLPTLLKRLEGLVGANLSAAQWTRLEQNLERELHSSRAIRLAEQLRPLLPLLQGRRPFDG